MGITSYDYGDMVRVGNHSGNASTGAFTNGAGVETDPDAVTLKVVKPDGTSTTYTYAGSPALSKETTGRYYTDVTLDQEGLWRYRLAGTGQAQAADERVLHVRKRVTA